MRDNKWGMIALVCTFGALASASLGKILPLIADVAASLSISQVQATWLISVIPLVAVLAAPIAGAIGDRFGDRLLLAAGVGATLAGNLVGALAHSYAVLLAGRALEGLGFVCTLTAVAAILMRIVAGRQLGAAMALLGAAVPGGVGIAEALAGQLAGRDWHGMFWGHAVFLAVGLLAVHRVPAWRGNGRPAQAQPHAADAQTGMWEIYRHARPVRLAICLGVLTLAQFGVSAMFPVYLHASFGIPLATGALLGALGLAAGLLGNVASSTLLGRGVDARRLAIGGLVTFGCIGTLTFLTALGATNAIAGSVLFLMAGGFTNGLFLALLPRVAPSPELRSRASGLVNQLTTFGLLFGAPIMFGVVGAGGGEAVLATLLVCTLATFLIMPLPRARRVRVSTESPS